MNFNQKITTTFVLIFLNLILLTTVSYAASNPSYTIVIDAGSSGSRLHIYKFDTHNSSNSLPLITDIAPPNTDVKPGISSYVNAPEDAGPALKPLFDVAEKTLKEAGIEISKVDFNLLGTAGMRILPVEKQLAIYDEIKAYLTETTPFKLNNMSTITGKMEGVYGWLTVNYLKKTLQGDGSIPTVGNLDMGGASTQITFMSGKIPFAGNVYRFKLADKNYTLFSHSFLYFGQDQARAKVASLACYPKGYLVADLGAGNFDYAACQCAVKKYIRSAAMSVYVPRVPATMTYIASSGYFYIMQFFNAKTIAQLIDAVNRVCINNWDTLQKQYPKEPVKYLASYCFNGTYIAALLTHGYRFRPDTKQIEVEQQIDNTEVNWAMGYAILQFIEAE